MPDRHIQIISLQALCCIDQRVKIRRILIIAEQIMHQGQISLITLLMHLHLGRNYVKLIPVNDSLKGFP